MATKKFAVKLTANFENNLRSIADFWNNAGAPHAYDQLLDELLESIIPNLERFPKLGRPLIEHTSRSAESRAAVSRLKTRIGRGEVREYLVSDYLILYALIDDAAHLLSIKHHKQLSFDLEGFWPK
jgi:plasmid stabilization system protein ParE